MLLKSIVLYEFFFSSYIKQLKLVIWKKNPSVIKTSCGIQKEEFKQDKKQKLDIIWNFFQLHAVQFTRKDISKRESEFLPSMRIQTLVIFQSPNSKFLVRKFQSSDIGYMSK